MLCFDAKCEKNVSRSQILKIKPAQLNDTVKEKVSPNIIHLQF